MAPVKDSDRLILSAVVVAGAAAAVEAGAVRQVEAAATAAKAVTAAHAVVRAATAGQVAPAAMVVQAGRAGTEARVGIAAALAVPSRDTGRSDALAVLDGAIRISAVALVAARGTREAKAGRMASAHGAIPTAAGAAQMPIPVLKAASPAARKAVVPAAIYGAGGAGGVLPAKAVAPAAGTRSSGLPSRWRVRPVGPWLARPGCMGRGGSRRRVRGVPGVPAGAPALAGGGVPDRAC